jgi:two-component system, OmpR family, sensor histidine kinase MprB
MSFRARLTLAATAAVAVAVVLASALVYVLVSDRLHSEIDASLRDRAARLTEEPRDRGAFFGSVPPAILGGARGFYQYVDSQGNVALPPFEVGQRPLPVDGSVRQVAAGKKGQFLTDKTVRGVHVRVLTVPAALFTAPTPTPIAVQIALPLTETDSTVNRLGWILFFVALGGVGTAFVLGLLVARAALAPVRRLTAATEGITETRDLSRRVEEGSRDELGRLGTSFNTMLAALDESQQAQRQLVSDASHELRTPLTSLRTNVEVLARGGLPDDDRRNALADVSSQLEELTVLITDVVDLARDGEREQAVEDVRLDLLVGDAVERARRHAPAIVFETELGESLVRGVPDRIFRAVANVLDNAAKWSPAGGKVEVGVAGGEVTVRDHGPGIAAEDLPHVFDRFYRSPAARGTPGSGLGLAIVHQVVDSHGGTVAAGPAEGGGTAVRLAFPHA